MIIGFLLFMMICDSAGHDCKPANGGYYRTEVACKAARIERREEMTDGQCKRIWISTR